MTEEEFEQQKGKLVTTMRQPLIQQQATSNNQMQQIPSMFSNMNVNIPVKSLLGKSELEEIVGLLKAKRIGMAVKKLHDYLVNQKLYIDEVDMNEILTASSRVDVGSSKIIDMPAI